MSARFATLSIFVALLASGCSSQTMTLEQPTLPAPLLDSIPLRVGVKYSPEMHDFTHREELLANQQWTIYLGSANKLLFDQIFAAMFDEVIVLGDDQDPNAAGVDLLIKPSVDAFEFALPQQSRSETYTVWIRYRLKVYDNSGEEVANWPVSAYGKAGAGRFDGTGAMKRAAALAMRDAAALVSLRFAKEISIGKDGKFMETAPPTEKLAESGESAGTAAAVAPPVEEEPVDGVSDGTNSEKFTNDQG